MEKLIEVLKKMPTWARVTFLAAAAAAALALSFSSCSRSTVRFKGSGDIEFDYVGSDRPVFIEKE